MLEDGDMRMLGAADGFVHAIADVRTKIWHLTAYQPIHPRHVRKLAAREKLLRPLRELEARWMQNLSDCRAAYEKSREPKPAPDYRHYYMPHKKFPWFCEHCGYGAGITLKHFQKGETVKSSVSA